MIVVKSVGWALLTLFPAEKISSFMADHTDIRICFVGESFVNGTGDRTYLGWAGRLCVDLAGHGYEVTYYNLGIRREISSQLLDRWQEEVIRRLPPGVDGRIVFCFGVNDTTLEGGKPRVALANSIQHTWQILSLARQQYPVLMVSPLPISDPAHNQRSQILSSHLAQVCQQLQIPYLDALTPLSQSAVWMDEVANGDGAHPDAAGYLELTRLVQGWSAWQRWFPVKPA